MNLPDKTAALHSSDDMMAYGASLFPATAEGQPHLPRWSPDGSRLLYQVTRKRQQKRSLGRQYRHAPTPSI